MSMFLTRDISFRYGRESGQPSPSRRDGSIRSKDLEIWPRPECFRHSGKPAMRHCPRTLPATRFFNGFSDELRWEKDGDDLVARAEMTIQLHNHNLGLAALAKAAEEKKMKPGRDFNIISYNESPINDIILNGLTTISTDFAEMGRLGAEMIINQDFRKVKCPFGMTRRKTF